MSPVPPILTAPGGSGVDSVARAAAAAAQATADAVPQPLVMSKTVPVVGPNTPELVAQTIQGPGTFTQIELISGDPADGVARVLLEVTNPSDVNETEVVVTGILPGVVMNFPNDSTASYHRIARLSRPDDVLGSVEVSDRFLVQPTDGTDFPGGPGWDATIPPAHLEMVHTLAPGETTYFTLQADLTMTWEGGDSATAPAYLQMWGSTAHLAAQGTEIIIPPEPPEITVTGITAPTSTTYRIEGENLISLGTDRVVVVTSDAEQIAFYDPDGPNSGLNDGSHVVLDWEDGLVHLQSSLFADEVAAGVIFYSEANDVLYVADHTDFSFVQYELTYTEQDNTLTIVASEPIFDTDGPEQEWLEFVGSATNAAVGATVDSATQVRMTNVEASLQPPTTLTEITFARGIDFASRVPHHTWVGSYDIP